MTKVPLTFALDMASMPTPARAHFEPSWKGDRLEAIDTVAHMAVGRDMVRAIDMNFQWDGRRAWNIHWASPWLNNYHWVIDKATGRVRPMTFAELHRPVWKWGDGARRWRRTSSKHSARPHTYAFIVRYAKPRGVLVTAEIKSRKFGTAAAARYLVEAARRADYPAWFMALLSMRGVRRKAEAIHAAGGQFALIFGRYRIVKPRDWAQWSYAVSAIWRRGVRWKHGS